MSADAGVEQAPSARSLQQVEGNLLALLIGVEVGGILGALFAVPVAGILWVFGASAIRAGGRITGQRM